LKWSETALDVNVTKNGATISGAYSGLGSGNFLLVRDKTRGRYMAYGYQGTIR
jgi:hypothetical protein